MSEILRLKYSLLKSGRTEKDLIISSFKAVAGNTVDESGLIHGTQYLKPVTPLSLVGITEYINCGP
jgi:hypothetical protein